MMPSEKQGRVQSVTYMKADDQDPTHLASAGPKVNGIPVLRVEFAYKGGTYTHDIPNGDFNVENPTLQFLAYLGLRPSDLDGQRLDVGSTTAPLVRTGENDYAIHADALEMGRERLEDVVWSPMVDHGREDGDASIPRSSGGGGGDDGGGGPPTRDSAQPESRTLPEGVGIDYDGESRGMTISVE